MTDGASGGAPDDADARRSENHGDEDESAIAPMGPVADASGPADESEDALVTAAAGSGGAAGESSRSVEELIAEYDEERPARKLSSKLEAAITAWCFVVGLFVIRQVFRPHPQGKQYYLITFLALTLPLIFLCYRALPKRWFQRRTDGPGITGWLFTAAAAMVCIYPVQPWSFFDGGGGGFDAFLDRAGKLSTTDQVMGTILTLLVLEAARRTTGWMIPVVCLGFIAYARFGDVFPLDWPIGHAGMNLQGIVNGFYNTQSGFYGTPLDVAASYIVLFTIYGAVLDRTGAGRFFIELSFSAFRKSRSAPGRTVTLSGLLLGSVSGSGTATAVSLGSVTWPILKRAGYPRENAGGLLAAAGIGAILSPPTLGAAAFIIAEYLGVSYLDVLLWAMVPTLLYYLGIILAVEIDSRRFGAREIEVTSASPWRLLWRYGYHLLSLGVIVLFLARDIPPFKAVVYATAVAAAFGLVERAFSRRDPLDPDSERAPLGKAMLIYGRDLYLALSAGVRSALPIVAVCAAAGIITSVITKTGLGQVLADLLVDAAEGVSDNPTVVLVVTAVFAAVAIVVLGLAVPVTASFIISWTVIGPALQGLGVSGPEAAMFVFYYSVLSEVSPPTALAAVASAAITGGNLIKTMWQTTKYTLPAFLVPIAFVITDNGTHLLWQGSFASIAWTAGVSALAVAALAVVTGGWILGPASRPERLLCLPAAGCLLYLQPLSITLGVAFFAAAVALHLATGGRGRDRQAPVDHTADHPGDSTLELSPSR